MDEKSPNVPFILFYIISYLHYTKKKTPSDDNAAY